MNYGCFIRNVLGQFHWYRRRQYGHWELWKLPGNYGAAWLRTRACFYTRGRGPDTRLIGGPVRCEHAWNPRCGYVALHEVLEMPEGMVCPVCRKPMPQHQAISIGDMDPYDKRPVLRLCTGQHVRIRDSLPPEV